jgi:hypothetical protein
VPRTPFWGIVATILTLGTYLLFARDAEAEQVSVGGNDLFVGGQRSKGKRGHPLLPVILFDTDKRPLILASQRRRRPCKGRDGRLLRSP